MRTDALIIGGGIAGLFCARQLSRLGLQSVIVEKAAQMGGHVSRYCCKATDQCQRCAACLLEEVADEVATSGSIIGLVRATISAVKSIEGLFYTTVSQRPTRISLEKCNNCAACLEACPASGALTRLPLTGQLALNEEACLHYKDGSCTACAEVCPERAISLDEAPTDLPIEAGSIILACGFRAFEPLEKPRLGYGRIPGVITGLELDSLLRADNFTLGERENGSRSVAFIQCVGSRDPRIGRNYCSRVCCGYALRLARLLRHRFPGIEPTMFYMDIQTFDRDFERRLEEARREVRLIRAIPPEVRAGTDGRPELIFQGPEDKRILESFDLVVLSVGISPDPSHSSLGELLRVSLNRDGFLERDEETVSTETPGVFVAGTVQGPKSIEETVSHATRTAGAVAAYLMKPDGEKRS